MGVEGLVRGGLLAAAVAVWACTPASPVITAQPAADITGDGSIAGAVSTANEGEILHARIALERAVSPEVRTFAQRLITEHTTADEQLRGALTRMKMLEGPSILATQLEENVQKGAELLRAIPDAQFDRTFIDLQIDMHEWLVRSLDGTLLPTARKEDLKAQLRMIRAAAVVHLERARQIRARLDS